MSHAIRFEAEARYPLNTTQGRDYKAWARRILHRFERGDKTLLPIQITFAHEAMDIPLPKSSD